MKARDENRRASNNYFPYYECAKCKTLFMHPVPRDLEKYYPSDYHMIPKDYSTLKNNAGTERYRIEIVQRFKIRGRLLEIGPGNGTFTHLAKEAGFQVEAIECDLACCRFLRAQQHIKAYHTNQPHMAPLRKNTYDVIACWHVLEHLSEPLKCIKAAASWLKPGGILLIAVPNPQALQFRILGRHWPHLDAPRHVVFMNLRALTGVMKEAGMKRIMRTCRDKGGLHWNRFGWEWALMNHTGLSCLKPIAAKMGRIIASIMRPVESVGMNGSTYTAIFRKAGRP